MKVGGAAGSSAFGAAILALFLLRGTATAPVGSTETGMGPGRAVAGQNAETQGKSFSKKWPDDGPWQASRKHFAGIWHEGDCPSYESEDAGGKNVASLDGVTLALKSGRQETSVSNPRERVWCIPSGEQVRAMIAIVPDPVHTHMALVFDRSVEAVQLAGEAVNYVVDRYWLPWEPETSGNNPLAQGKAHNASQPGLLMFRWNGDVDQSGEAGRKGKPGASGASVLYVFLVSDTSTAGINGDQFSKAVDYIQVVCGGTAGPECGSSSRIRIMGPTFSGSLSSLRRLTESKAPQLFTAYSGTVSSICALQHQHLLSAPSPECGEPPPAYAPVANLEFKKPLVNDTETAVRKFLGLLKDGRHIQCGDPPDVAILSEAATTYGGVSRLVEKKKSRKTTKEENKPTCNYASLSFPREISSLRNAYQSAGRQTPAADVANPGAVQSSLPFNLADRQPNNSDEPPDFSQPQGPLSKEAVLMDFAANLRRSQYKYIGIIGSNVLDVLFLASFLRTNCPDMRLFVLNSDLLFERNPDNAPFIGTLTIATYPLFGRNLTWTSPHSRLARLPFADQYEEGQYNAALLAMQEVVPPGLPQTPQANLYEFREPFTGSPDSFDPNSATLPLWVTVVGTGGFWPVQVIHDQKSGPESPGSALKLDDMDFSGAWKAVLAVLIALAFLHILVLLTASPVSPRLRDFAVGVVAGTQRLFFIQVASACLALCLAMACAPAWRYGLSAGGAVLAMAVAVPIAVGSLFIVCMRLNYVCRREMKELQNKPAGADRGHLRYTAFSLGVWVIAVLGGCLWWRLLGDSPSHYGFFFAYRAIHMATGVSPFTPTLPLFVAMYFWCICEIWRLRFNDQVRPRLNAGRGWPGAVTEDSIAHSVSHYWLNRNNLIGLILVFIVWLFFLDPISPFHLFEHYLFGRLYEALFCLVVSLMLSSGFRLGQIWTGLRRLLRELERSPIRYAFSRLKGESWSPIWQSGGQEDEWTNMARSFEVMKQIRLGDNALDPKLRKGIGSAETLEAIGSAETLRDTIVNLMNLRPGKRGAAPAVPRDGKGTAKPQTDREFFRLLQGYFSDIQVRLATVLNNALGVLQKHWDKHCYGDAGEGEQNDDNKVVVHCATEKPDEGAQQVRRLEEYVALRYVAFIRGTLGHVRHLLIFLAVSFSLVLLSLNIYSFEPHQSLVWSLTVIFGVIGLLAMGVLMEAYRNQILSRISGTKANELDLSFYVRVISLGAAPLFTLMATNFPSIGRFLLSFFQPGLEGLK
jgi:hypothetical protein